MKKITKKIFKLSYINFFTLLFSSFLGAILIFSNNFVYKGNVYTKYSEIVINNISFWEIVLFLIISIIIYILLSIVSLTIYFYDSSFIF